MADVLYKALVPTRWKNRLTGKHEHAFAGAVVEFDEGDFALPGEPSTALPPLAELLARGQFAVWDPRHAGDPDYMSRDEMLNLIDVMGLLDDAPAHDTPASELKPIIQAYLDRMAAAGTPPVADASSPTTTKPASRRGPAKE